MPYPSASPYFANPAGMWQTLCPDVQAILGGTGNPPPHWEPLIRAGLTYAASVIRRALAVRGFRPDQIGRWDDWFLFLRRVAICNVFREGGIGKGYDSLNLSEYCKAVGELGTVPFTIDGVVIDPKGDTGGCSSGDFAFSTQVNVPGGFASDNLGPGYGAGTDPDRWRGGYW